MTFETAIGGGIDGFPQTCSTAIANSASSNAEIRRAAFETIVQVYWKPAYKYIRRKWNRSNEDAKDLTQAFFTRAFEKSYFAAFDASRASFRTFLRICIDRFLANEEQQSTRLKRGGMLILESLDFSTAEQELCREPVSPEYSVDELFYREWVRSLFEIALHELQKDCRSRSKEVLFEVFTQYDIEPFRSGEPKPSYAELAQQYGIKVTDVTNYLGAMRREFRRMILDRLRSITANEAEFRREARTLFDIAV